GGNTPRGGGVEKRTGGDRSAAPPAQECLFSPSGAGWQHHLEKRHSLELERSAFNEQDLSLVQMKFPGISRKDADYSALARDIQGKIAFEDLVFEFDEDGYAVVLPNSNLDQSIGIVKNFLNTLNADILARHPHPQCGLTSRNGRIVDGARLIVEGRKALEKTAATDSGNIVGFRPDPGKYRKYVSDRGAPREA
ncbi:MAG: hypothetical protein RBT16_14020, partial [Desulfococcus multivorans]|nr:hypothetical protein [Desulfococcus multivorans]